MNWVQIPSCAQGTIDAEALFEKGDEFYEAQDYDRAKSSYKNALVILLKSNADRSLLYYQILVELASLAEEEEDYYGAVRYMEKAMTIDNDTVREYIKNEDGVYTPYRKLSDYYAKAGIWDKAISLKQQRLRRKWNNRHNGNFDIALEDYMHWIENANYYKFALRILRDLYEDNREDKYYNHWMGECYYHFRDYDKALFFFDKARAEIGKAKVYAAKGNITTAIDILKKVVSAEKEDRKHAIYISGHEPYWGYLSILANYYNINENYDDAIECESLNKKSAISFLNIGRAYCGKRLWNKAIQYSLEAYNMNQQEGFRALALLNLCNISYLANYKYDLQKYVSELIQCVSKDLLSTFKELTYDERSRFIEQYSKLLSNQIPMYAYYVRSDSITSSAYNASLLIKGALLVSENSIKHIINESHDESLKTLWEELRADRYILSKQLEKDSLERKLNIDSLQNVIYNLEDSLVVRCKEYDVITKNMSLKWDVIRDCLTQQDIAIEFLRVPINNDSIIYAALTLRKDSKVPKLTVLFEEKQLKEVSDTLFYHCKEMSDLVWKPLLPELQGIKNVYFAPSGALYNIGIEYLPGMEDYNIYRLSSTRELATGGETRTGKRAVLYGGLDYYAQLDTLSRSLGLTALSETFVEHANVRGLNVRGGKERLKHTQEEVELIGKELNKADWTCLLDTASIGTEESFKSLSGKQINTLHIATHGFYYTQEEADNKGYQFMLLDENRTSAEDKALTRSGLLMAGANHVLAGDTIPDNVEDGILTAKEIADVDLRGLDLVVLSACQTGLGDIAQSEGVFGLQRGFKKAGAKAILMSLWEVDDKATQILMTQFYKNFVSGLTKRQALKSAQKYLREVEGGKYDEPKYWAAFILLDGDN